MLKNLNIRNFALVDLLQLDFQDNFNVLTGETGAGKSIIIDAIEMLMGNRGSADMIRTGEQRASIEGTFVLDEQTRESIKRIIKGINGGAASSEEELDVSLDIATDELMIRREMSVNNRGRAFINDQVTTLATLREIAALLLEIHGQGEQHELGAARVQMDLLDEFAENEKLRVEVGRIYDERQIARRELERTRQARSEQQRLREYIKYQLQELENLNFSEGEEERLRGEKHILGHAEKALAASSAAYRELYEQDDSIIAKLAAVKRFLQDLSAINPASGESVATVEAAMNSLSEVAGELRSFETDYDFSAGRLNEVEERLAQIERIKRKYGGAFNELSDLQKDLERQLESVDALAEKERELTNSVGKLGNCYKSAAAKLTHARRSVLSVFERQVTRELRELKMEQAQFKVRIESFQLRDESAETYDDEFEKRGLCTARGADKIEFMLSANEGEDIKPLAQVASGGELSRIMLTLRTVCSKRLTNQQNGNGRHARTLIFDEVDAGVSGRIAEAVGRKINFLSRGQQVICVTHQPQLARFAKHHFTVAKSVAGGRTRTTVRPLQHEERIGELARLIGGAEELATARATASWMLEQSEQNFAPPVIRKKREVKAVKESAKTQVAEKSRKAGER